MPKRRLAARAYGVLGLVVLACACGSTGTPREPTEPGAGGSGAVAAATGSEADGDEGPPPPTIPGVALRLEMPTAVWDTGAQPDPQLTFMNGSAAAIRIGSPIEGSWQGFRQPRYTLELVDERGTVIPDALGPPPAYCATVPRFQPGVDDAAVAPGESVDVYQRPHVGRFPLTVLTAARPGKYQARVRYSAREPGISEMTVLSNSVAVEIRGGNLATWTCYRDLVAKERADRDERLAVSLRPGEVVAVGDRFAVVYVREELRRVAGAQRDRFDLGVQLFGAGGPVGAPAVLGVPAVELARAAASDRGLLVAYASGGFTGERVAVVSAQIDGERVRFGEPESLSGGLTMIPSLVVERSGGTIAVAYLRDGGEGKAELVVHGRSAATGAAGDESVIVGGRDQDLRDLQIAPADKQGFVVVWTDRDHTYVAMLDGRGGARSQPVALGERIGAVRAVAWRAGGGLDLAYFADGYLSESERARRGFYLQSFLANGGTRGAAQPLSPPGDYDFFWGDLAWGGTAMLRAYAPPRSLRGGVASTGPLVLGPVGGEVKELSASAMSAPVLAARGDEFAVAWSDSRHDVSQACVRAGECVGEVHVAIQRKDGAARLAPTRVTRASVPAAVASYAAERWQELCE